MNIMLIDDDEDCIISLANALSPTGYHCSLFTVPEQAVAEYKLEKQRYHVVISDLKMPGMSGMDVLKILRAYDRAVRVILVTGYGEKDAILTAQNLGAYAFLDKPIPFGGLIDLLEQIDQEVMCC